MDRQITERQIQFTADTVLIVDTERNIQRFL